MTKIFIDGSAGTTGLRIYERLAARSDLVLITLPDEVRKDPAARADALSRADVAFLCLPDAAACEAVENAGDADTVIIDTSTAHRTSAGWTYGFAELSGKREQIRTSRRIANPGCHASGFVSLVAPLVEAGVIGHGAMLSCFSLTGYSGGGKKMIADYEAEDAQALSAPRMYGISQGHKHLPEMQAVCALDNAPLFSPIVSSYYSGMEVVVPLFRSQLTAGAAQIKEIYADYYRTGLVRFVPDADESGFMSASALAGRDDMEISVFGNDERILLVSRFDNLGKGASGAAIQNMNIVLGAPEQTGLNIGGK